MIAGVYEYIILYEYVFLRIPEVQEGTRKIGFTQQYIAEPCHSHQHGALGVEGSEVAQGFQVATWVCLKIGSPQKKRKRKLIHGWLAMIYPNLSQSRIVFQLIMGCATGAFVPGTDQDSPPQSPGERLREKDAGLHTPEIPRKTGSVSVMCSHVFSPKVSIIVVHNDMLCILKKD